MTSAGPRRNFKISLPEHQIEEIRQGYRCIKCLGPQPEPFPDKCVEPWCPFPIKKEQLRWFQEMFRGYEYHGPLSDVTEFDYEMDGWVPKNGILVPRAT